MSSLKLGNLAQQLPQLLQEGFNVNELYKWKGISESDRRFTPLQISCYEGHVRDAEALIQAGADVDHATEIEELTCLMLPFKGNSRSLVELLIKHGADVNKCTSDDGSTALHFASKSKDTEKLEALLSSQADLNQQDSNNMTPLFLAVTSRFKAGVNLLIKRGTSVNHRSNLGGTPAMLAAQTDDTDDVEGQWSHIGLFLCTSESVMT